MDKNMNGDDARLEGAACPVCRAGTLHAGTYVNTFEEDGAIVVVKNVPGWVCDSCGEGYSSEQTTDRLLDLAQGAFERGAEVEVLRYSPTPARAA